MKIKGTKISRSGFLLSAWPVAGIVFTGNEVQSGGWKHRPFGASPA